MGEIISLGAVVRSNVRSPLGIMFPSLYRYTGYAFKYRPGCSEYSQGPLEDIIEPNLDIPLPPRYTLGQQYVGSKLALPEFTRIDHLDPTIDTGLVIIRHHATREQVIGYMDALWDRDATDDSENYTFSSFETELGLFTIQHRPPNPGAATCAIVYTAKMFDPRIGQQIDWYHVIDHTGKEINIDTLLASEESSEGGPYVVPARAEDQDNNPRT